MNRLLSRAKRTLLQLVAGGGLATAVSFIGSGHLPPLSTLVGLVGAFLVMLAQNSLEAAGAIKPLFETEHAAPLPADWVGKRLATDEHPPAP